MAGVKSGIRNMKVDTGSGTDVKNTDMLSGEAKKTKAFNEKNSTEQHKSATPPHDKLGGENTNS